MSHEHIQHVTRWDVYFSCSAGEDVPWEEETIVCVHLEIKRRDIYCKRKVCVVLAKVKKFKKLS